MGWGEENDKNLESWKEWILKPHFESNRTWTLNEEFALKQTFYTKPAQIQGPSCKISVASTVFLLNFWTGTKVIAVQGGHPNAKILKLCKHG